MRRTIYPQNNTIQQWMPEIWPLEHYCLLWIGSFKFCTSLSNRIFSIISHLLFFGMVGLFCSKGIFSINYNFFPYLYLYVSYFIFHINYPVSFLHVYFLLFSRKFMMMISVKRIVFFQIPPVCYRGVWEEQYIHKSAQSNGGCQRYGHQNIITFFGLAPPNSALLSLAEFSLLSLTFFFSRMVGLFAVLKAYFSLIKNFPLIYAFMYFILFFT